MTEREKRLNEILKVWSKKDLWEQAQNKNRIIAELRARLEKAVELPRIIHPNKSEWHIQYQYESGIIDSEIKFSEEAAEARLKEIKEEI